MWRHMVSERSAIHLPAWYFNYLLFGQAGGLPIETNRIRLEGPEFNRFSPCLVCTSLLIFFPVPDTFHIRLPFVINHKYAWSRGAWSHVRMPRISISAPIYIYMLFFRCLWPRDLLCRPQNVISSKCRCFMDQTMTMELDVGIGGDWPTAGATI